jgi:signal transduction histidine kinase
VGEVTEVEQAAGRAPESSAMTDRGAARQAAEEAVERERARIARELHDGIATDLAAAISLFKTHMEGHPGFGSAGGPDEILGDVFGILERMLKQVRDTLAELRPRPIGPEGLLGDLRTQADEFARLYSIRVEISSNGTEDMLPPQQREVVYQVVREALTNVRKHSDSSICRVRLAFAARPFMIEVADEGRGFRSAPVGGYGLVGMRERAAGIGGRLEVVSTEGRGTTVFLFGPN